MKSRSLAEAYFKAWNDHDLSQLETVLHKSVRLIDWDLDVHGLSAVLDANAKIFADHPNIYATPLNIVAAEERVVAQLTISLKESVDPIHVVDWFEISDGCITLIRAYRGF